MQVFKFGGASVKDAAGMRNVAGILGQFSQEQLVIIVSATGKTTNALEDVVNAYFKKSDNPNQLLQKVKDNHQQICTELFEGSIPEDLTDDLGEIYASIEWVLEEPVQDSYDYIYDQIVSQGEFISTKILAAYLNIQNLPTQWLDARDVLLTDDRWREPNIVWDETEKRISSKVAPMLNKGFVVTQGFVGSTNDNNTTTLGREGSDFSASIFAYSLRASRMAIWKDVIGVLNADPRLFPEATKIDHLSYDEAIEMTFYGAQVIHPKTMRPLQIRNIPLNVKCFLDAQLPGTVVDSSAKGNYPPIIVVKKNQSLLRITSKDFYFIDEPKMAKLFEAFAKYRIKVNLMQNSAMSLLVCVDNRPDNIADLTLELVVDFGIEKTDSLELITVRHHNADILNGLKYGKTIMVEERSTSTAQMVVKN